MEPPLTIETLINMGQVPILVWIGYLLFKLSQQFTALAARIDTILQMAVGGARAQTEDHHAR